MAGTNTSDRLDPTSPSRTITSLAEAIEFDEEVKGAKRFPIPQDAHLADLDYESRLSINPRKDDLESLSASDAPVLPELSREDEGRLEQLETWIQLASVYVKDARQINEEIRQIRLKTDLSSQQIGLLQDKIRAQARLGSNAVEQIFDLAKARAITRLGADADEDQIASEITRLTDHLFKDDQGNEVDLNVGAFARFLTEEMRFGIAVATNDMAVVERDGTTRLRIRAWVISQGKAPLAAHVENYDDIEDPMPPKDPRVSFRMSESDRERVDRGYRLAGDVGRLIQDVKTQESSLRQGFGALLQSTRTDLRRFRSDLERLDLVASPLIPPDLAGLLTNAVAIVTNSANADEATKQEMVFLLRDLALISQQRSNLVSLVEMAGEASSEDLVQTFASVSEGLNDLALSIINLPLTLQTNVSRLGSLVSVLGQIEGPQAAELATSLAESLLPETTRKAQELIDLFKTSYPNLAKEVADIMTRAPTAVFASEIDDAAIDPRVKALALDQVVPGAVNLDNLPADRGDKLRVRAELIVPSGDQEQVIASEHTFAVDRFAWISRFSAHLAFVNREGDDGDFVPAPSVSWTLHHRLRERQQTRRTSKVWSFLDPGVGVNAAALSLRITSKWVLGRI